MDTSPYNVISTIIPWGDETERFNGGILSSSSGRLVVFAMMCKNIRVLFRSHISLPITDPLRWGGRGRRRKGEPNIRTSLDEIVLDDKLA